MTINTTTLSGHAAADPESRDFESGAVVTRFTLYQNEYRGEDQDGKVHRFHVEAWGGVAKYLKKHLHKGSLAVVQGTLIEDTWQDDQGNRSRIIVKATRVEILAKAKDHDETAAYDDDPEF